MAHLPDLLVLKGSDTAPAHAGADVLRVLLDAGVISSEDVVNRDVVIRDRSSRNLAFEIEVQGRGASFAKLARDAESAQRIRREALALEALERVGLRLGPVLLAGDRAGLLVIQGLSDHETPWSLSSDERCRPPIGAALGRGLGLLHRSEADLPGEDIGPPPAVALAEPDASARGGLGPGAAALAGVLGKDPSAAESLAAAAAGWLPLAPTHRDVKWDNVLVGVGAAGEVERASRQLGERRHRGSPLGPRERGGRMGGGLDRVGARHRRAAARRG